MFLSRLRHNLASFAKHGKTIICILITFGLFFPLFVQKEKLFILEGTAEISAPTTLTAYIAGDETHVFSSFSAIELAHDETFRLKIKGNNVYGLKIVFNTPDVRLNLSDFRLVGKSEQKLSFDKIQIDGFKNVKLSEQGKNLHLQTTQKAGTIIFSGFSKLPAKRVYSLSPLFAVFLLLFIFLKSPRKEQAFKIYILLLPLMLLGCIKYFAFLHPFLLYYQNTSLHNIFLLEKYEFGVFAAFYALLAIILYTNNKMLQFIFSAALCLLFIIIMIDGIILHNLNARFIFSEISNYGTEYAVAFWMSLAYFKTLQGRLLIACGIILIYIVKYRQKFSAKYAFVLGLTALLLKGISVYYKTDFLFDYEFCSVFQANNGHRQAKSYSPEFQKQLLQSFQLKQKCISGLNTRKNVIIIIVESLSSFCSRKTGGIYDYMPEFDKLAEDNILYSGYYSNSYNTAGGIFSLMTGLPSIHSFNGLDGISNGKLYADALPKRLKQSGYSTYFFSSIELNGQMRDIATLSGFDFISDFSDSYYDGKQRFIFNAPADEHLFANVIRHIGKKDFTRPYLAVISTISGHGPYINPDTQKQSFEETVRYVDRQIGIFVKNLKTSGFFKDGILLITGDHRAMVPVSAEEYAKMPPLTEGRVPLLIIAPNLKISSDGIHSHNDVAPSLQYYLTDKGCFNEFQHNLFDKNKKHNCLIHQKLSPRNKVELLCNDKQAGICLNGDETAFCNGGHEQKYIDFINWLRLLPQ